MTHIEFFPYHNFHIRFKLSNGNELSGVLADTLKPNIPGEPDTLYAYIPTNRMIEWKQAEKDNDKEKMRNLEGKIDIAEIIWAERLKY